MKKLAVFVEGLTEELFCEHLIRHVASDKRVAISAETREGGSVGPRRIVEIRGDRIEDDGPPDGQIDYFVLIVNSGQDQRVLSDIREEYDGLAKKNYDRIIGVRDVFPQKREQIDQIRKNFATLAPQKPIPTECILAVMEVEAWILGEDTHLAKLDARLDDEMVRRCLGYDPGKHDIENLVDNPASDLERVYWEVTLIWDKSRGRTQRTLAAVDFQIVCATKSRFSDLKRLVDITEEFFA